MCAVQLMNGVRHHRTDHGSGRQHPGSVHAAVLHVFKTA